jgi:hypothetical protein
VFYQEPEYLGTQPRLHQPRRSQLHGPSSEELIPEIQAHQLRRRFPSDDSLRRGDRPFTGLRHPKVRWSFNYRCLAKPKPSDVLRPFLGRSLSRPALLFRPKSSEPRRARGRSTLPAPLPDWPRDAPKSASGLTRWSSQIHAKFPGFGATRDPYQRLRAFAYGAVTLYGSFRLVLKQYIIDPRRDFKTRQETLRSGSLPQCTNWFRFLITDKTVPKMDAGCPDVVVYRHCP